VAATVVASCAAFRQLRCLPASPPVEAARAVSTEISAVPAIEIDLPSSSRADSRVDLAGPGGGGDHGSAAPMIPVPSGVRVRLAVGRTDMRRGMNGLALQVQQTLRRDPDAGDLYVFRGRRGDRRIRVRSR
jgi:IS66 Orf2 like protein